MESASAGVFVPLGTTQGNRFEDKGATPGNTRIYRVAGCGEMCLGTFLSPFRLPWPPVGFRMWLLSSKAGRRA